MLVTRTVIRLRVLCSMNFVRLRGQRTQRVVRVRVWGRIVMKLRM